MITVHCLAGLSPTGRRGPTGSAHLGGQLFRAPFERRDVLYNNAVATLATATEAAEKAHAAAIAAKGPIVLFGVSHGARALCLMLRDGPDLDPEKVVVVMMANPERKYGGALTIPSSGHAANFGGPGIPDDTSIRVYDIARQYDYWADYPNVSGSTKALRNVREGLAQDLLFRNGPHSDYSMVSIGDPANLTYTEGTRTYILAPTLPMPMCRRVWWDLKRECLEDAKERPEVEKGYSRPFTVPPQTVARTATGAGYDVKARAAVRLSPPPPWNPFS